MKPFNTTNKRKKNLQATQRFCNKLPLHLCSQDTPLVLKKFEFSFFGRTDEKNIQKCARNKKRKRSCATRRENFGQIEVPFRLCLKRNAKKQTQSPTIFPIPYGENLKNLLIPIKKH